MASVNSQSVAQRLQKYERFGVDLGLDRILKLLAQLGNPHRQVPVIHVAGTNGKGSVCAYLSSVLNAAGYRVGRYTSPHLIEWEERITLNESPVTAQVLQKALDRVEAAISSDQPTPTQFEVLTATAWLIFDEAAVDVAVIEVGLGGRLDATNVCDRPLATVITSISREHWQRLGSTLAKIAAEKAGILKAQSPAIIGPLPAEAAQVVQDRTAALGCPVEWVTPAQWMPNLSEPHAWAIARDVSYPLPLAGDLQLINSAIAIATLKELQQQGWRISESAIQAGMAQTQWPGRLQWTTWPGVSPAIPILIDGAHNPAAAVALRQYLDHQYLDQQPRPIAWLMGMLSTKDHREIFEALLRPGDRLMLVPVAEHSTANPTELAELAQTICQGLETCETALSLQEALNQLEQRKPGAETVNADHLEVLCGSLYLIGEFLALRNTQTQT